MHSKSVHSDDQKFKIGVIDFTGGSLGDCLLSYLSTSDTLFDVDELIRVLWYLITIHEQITSHISFENASPERFWLNNKKC